MNWFLEPWRRRQRRLDVIYLWPAILRQAESLDHAYCAFTMHAVEDPAWRCLGEDGIRRELAKLPTGMLS